jgi:hypothetical protein
VLEHQPISAETRPAAFRLMVEVEWSTLAGNNSRIRPFINWLKLFCKNFRIKQVKMRFRFSLIKL